MSDIAERIASLPPEKRALFAARFARAERSARGREQIPRRETAGPAPFTYTQQSVWFLAQLYPKNVAYNSPIAVHLTGRRDSDALEWSWNQIICRHDLLRTVFELHQGDPAQYPTPFRPIRLRRMDFGDLAEPQRMEAARREAVRQARQPFNLVAGQLWRAKRLCCCSEREHVFVVILHHIICDGWPSGIVVREVIAAFPQIPLLGFDIVREVSTGKLFVLEPNSIGYVWNFDARIKASYGLSAEAQFDGPRKAAYILAEKTQQSAD